MRRILGMLQDPFAACGGGLQLGNGVQQLQVGEGQVRELQLEDGAVLRTDSVLSCAGHVETMALCDPAPEIEDAPTPGWFSAAEPIPPLSPARPTRRQHGQGVPPLAASSTACYMVCDTCPLATWMALPMARYMTPPVVLDTNVLVAGACRRQGSRAYEVLMAVLRGRTPLILTPAIALEYQDVLQRPGVRELTGLTHEQSVDLVDDLIVRSRRVHIHFEWHPNLQDESDNKFVEAAISGRAIVVTYNTRDYERSDLIPHGWSLMTPNRFAASYLQDEEL